MPDTIYPRGGFNQTLYEGPTVNIAKYAAGAAIGVYLRVRAPRPSLIAVSQDRCLTDGRGSPSIVWRQKSAHSAFNRQVKAGLLSCDWDELTLLKSMNRTRRHFLPTGSANFPRLDHWHLACWQQVYSS